MPISTGIHCTCTSIYFYYTFVRAFLFILFRDKAQHDVTPGVSSLRLSRAEFSKFMPLVALCSFRKVFRHFANILFERTILARRYINPYEILMDTVCYILHTNFMRSSDIFVFFVLRTTYIIHYLFPRSTYFICVVFGFYVHERFARVLEDTL